MLAFYETFCIVKLCAVSRKPESTPRWVKVLGAVAVVLVLVVVIALATGGGGHGPGRHAPSGDTPSGESGGHTPPAGAHTRP